MSWVHIYYLAGLECRQKPQHLWHYKQRVAQLSALGMQNDNRDIEPGHFLLKAKITITR